MPCHAEIADFSLDFIGLILYNSSYMATTRRVVLLLETSRQYGRDLLLGVTQYSYFHGSWTFYREPGGRERSLPQLDSWGAHGIIAHASDARAAEKIAQTDIPAVIKGFKIPDIPVIVTDNVKIGTLAADHLLDRGFRHFAYCGFDNWYWSVERGEAFARRLRIAGFDTHFYRQPSRQQERTWDKEQKVMAEWLRSLPKPIGLMTCVDDRSHHVLDACKIAGCDVPNDVAIIGVDNDELICRLAKPQLTSVSLNAERAGYEAAELLDRLMSGEKPAGQQILTEPTHVETRQSTDILAMQDSEVSKAVQYIRQHPNESLQVGDVVKAVALSRRSLQLRFRRILGRSILDEIRRVRIDHVAEMLTETNLPVSKIALALGYPGIDHIARSFRKEKGMSPLTYRKRFGRK